jgi:hypothetical protein
MFNSGRFSTANFSSYQPSKIRNPSLLHDFGSMIKATCSENFTNTLSKGRWTPDIHNSMTGCETRVWQIIAVFSNYIKTLLPEIVLIKKR